MKYDLSKIMTNAWEIAENGFLNACINSSSDFDSNFKRKLNTWSVREKREFITRDYVVKQLSVNFSKKDFFSTALEMSWKTAKDNAAREQRKMEREIKEQAAASKENKIKIMNKNAPRRELIVADKYSEGDMLGKYIITGLGVTFEPNVDMFSMGISPSTDYVQYAYFN